MPDRRRATCQGCGKKRGPHTQISWSGLCEECAIERVAANLTALGLKTGPRYRRWQHALVSSLGGVLRDEAE